MTEEDSDAVDLKIAAAESRIKLWVVTGVLANLLAVLVLAIPVIFYFGQIDQKLTVVASMQDRQQNGNQSLPNPVAQ